MQKLGYDQTPYIHVGNGNFETKVNGKFNSVTADKIYAFLNEDVLNEDGSSIKCSELLKKIDEHIKSIANDTMALIMLYSDVKKHKADFPEIFDSYNDQYKGLTLLRYFAQLNEKLDTNIGLWCLKHYQESGMSKKYPRDVVEQAVSWMRVYKYDPDVFFGDMDLTNSEAVAFFKKKGFKF